MDRTIFISREGYQKLVAELEELKKRRPVISHEIKEAREKGDLKENAEYHAAKEELAHIQRRIADLESKIGSARLLDETDIPADKAYIGASVSVRDDSGTETTYMLVDGSESNPAEGKISVDSPIGKALLGRGPGETVKVPVGKSGYTLKILKISR